MNVWIKMNALRTLADLIKNALILLAAIFAKQEVKYSPLSAKGGRPCNTEPIFYNFSTP